MPPQLQINVSFLWQASRVQCVRTSLVVPLCVCERVSADIKVFSIFILSLISQNDTFTLLYMLIVATYVYLIENVGTFSCYC